MSLGQKLLGQGMKSIHKHVLMFLKSATSSSYFAMQVRVNNGLISLCLFPISGVSCLKVKLNDARESYLCVFSIKIGLGIPKD